jgi:hypothetical protein
MDITFRLGQIVMTRSIAIDVEESAKFAREVTKALRRYASGDWGDICAEDAQMNNEAVNGGDRILAAYNTSNGKIWIITEWDRSATTILYPEDY